MNDPTYDQAKIQANPIWQVAFSLSEIMNDKAPLGWGQYIWIAECLLVTYDMKRKQP